MTVDAFIAWTDTLEDDARYELMDGAPVAMSPERVAHADAKGLVYERLRAAVRERRLPCQVLIDGVGVRVGARTMYIPDVLVRCGEILDPDLQEVNDPVVIVEVVSPSTQHIDVAKKFIGYFALPSLRHYLIVFTAERKILHHRRRDDGVIESRTVSHETLGLDPPGIALEGLFSPEEA